MVGALTARGIAVETVSVPRVSRSREMANLALGVPYYRAKYFSPRNVALVRQAAEADAVVCSWEPLDLLAFASGVKVIPILHNITSRALPSMYPGNPATTMLAAGARQWERRAYGPGPFPLIGVLARQDEAAVTPSAGRERIVYLPPGLPPVAPLSPSAELVRELAVLGTFGWRPKHRDLMRMANEYAGSPRPWTIFADELPADARRLLSARPWPEADASAALRIGLVTDRFEAGHKLKVGSYIANNAVVVSYSDVRGEYRGMRHSDLFIRKIGHFSEIEAIYQELASMAPPVLRQRWLAFQQDCQQAFNWNGSARVLHEALIGLRDSDPHHQRAQLPVE
ncbi:MAG TPA: hypothetical protein VL418_05190 [Devosiaceae bacterium]|nr:hypothetical protein [Devosiaceae bacterium]